MKPCRQYICIAHRGDKFIFAVTALAGFLGAVAACGPADPRDPRGAIAAAAEAVERGDGRKLFRLIDQRSRHAFSAIQAARSEARKLVLADYPSDEQGPALAVLGDAAVARDAADLFVQRCPAACQAEIGHSLAAPVAERKVGDELEVETATGGKLRLRRGNDTWYGLVWKTAELSEERDRAARELEQIKQNAAVYRKRKALEAEQ
jgi:hypothetical protein